MLIHTFRGPGRVFGFTTDSAGANLPSRYAPWTAFKSLDMHRDEPHAGVDVNSCLDDIDTYGFHLTDAHERITQTAIPA
ncbi:MAG: hypothetical protein WC729_03050 [Sphingomonas sp.]|jgi:hypothetical protein|uniref:hypothetical protein n=1 Tax=Sphingomonas sp. TaxID=28214 RepID=UPI003568CF17